MTPLPQSHCNCPPTSAFPANKEFRRETSKFHQTPLLYSDKPRACLLLVNDRILPENNAVYLQVRSFVGDSTSLADRIRTHQKFVHYKKKNITKQCRRKKRDLAPKAKVLRCHHCHMHYAGRWHVSGGWHVSGWGGTSVGGGSNASCRSWNTVCSFTTSRLFRRQRSKHHIQKHILF